MARSGRSVLVMACAVLGAGVALGMGTGPSRLTLLVAPARHNTLQVAFDVLARENAVLVAYQGDAASAHPVLHVWNGQEWLQITPEEFGSLSFLRTVPSRILMVGDDALLPPVLADAAMAHKGIRVMQVPSQDTATVVNSIGQVLGFSRGDWAWFAARYRLDLKDVNASIRDRSWYDQPNTFRGRIPPPWADRSSPSGAVIRPNEPTLISRPDDEYAPVLEPIPEPAVVSPAITVIAPDADAPIK